MGNIEEIIATIKRLLEITKPPIQLQDYLPMEIETPIKKSKISEWALAIQAHEGYFMGSRSWRNNNPANFKVSVLTPFMKELGGTGLDSGGFVKFPSYAVGFQALCTFLTYACQDKLRAYKGNMTLLEFFKVYAPSADKNNPVNYATYIANKLGVKINTAIKELL